MSLFTVVVDTREQQPWSFENYAIANNKLDTGDYSIQGLEHILCIERKKSVSEIANNITEKRFKDVISRMSSYKYAFFIFEFDLEDVLIYPIGSSVPKRMWDKIKISPGFILKKLTDIQIENNIRVLFCGGPTNASKIAMSIMRKVYDLEKHNQKDI
jgi:ERCC4-type nuclease